MMRRYIIFILLLILPVVAVAEENTRTLTLQEAITIAMDKNRDVQKAKEYIAYLEGRYVEERSAALPQVTISAGIARTKDASTAAALGGSDTVNVYNANLSVRQALYTWGQVNAAIRVAKVGLKTGDEQLRLYQQAVTRDVAEAFADILLAKELLVIQQENVKQKERHLFEAEKKFALGTATDYDVLSAKVALQNAKPDVITADNRLRIAKDNLKFLLGIPEDIEVAGSLKTPIRSKDGYDKLMKTAVESRPEIRDIGLTKEIAAELITINNAYDKPRFDFVGSLGTTRLEDDGRDKDIDTWQAGVQLTYPIFDGFRTKGKVAQAKSDFRKAKLQELQIIDSVSLELKDALNRVQEAEEIISATEGVVSQAERLLLMAEKGYEYGVKTKLDVDDAEFNLRSARANLASGYRNYQVAYANLMRAAGIISTDTLK